MDRNEFTKRLAAGVLVCDGAMGTQLYARGLANGACGVRWNVDQPQHVRRIHESYIQAGCQIITTNTFQAGRRSLALHGLSDDTALLNRAGAAVARQAAGASTLVAADIGPFGGFLEPVGETSESELLELFTEQLAAMRDGGADLVLIETMSDPSEVAVAIAAARSVADWPIVATFTFQHAGDRLLTMMGQSVAEVSERAIEAGADVVGTNCGTALDLDAYRELAGQFVAAAGDHPVIVQPNAGSPIERDGQLHYPATPADMAALAVDLRDMGVRVIGGCCGTSPAHLAAMASALH